LSLLEKPCFTRSLSTDHKTWSQHPEGKAKSSLTWCQTAAVKYSGCRRFIFSLMYFYGSIKYTALSIRWFLWHCLKNLKMPWSREEALTPLWSLMANKQLLHSLEVMYLVDVWRSCHKQQDILAEHTHRGTDHL
jgi:hypothetical protein